MAKPSWDEYFLRLADVAASRSSCSRRQVGAVVVRGHHVIATGYNGTPSGFKNCDEGGCSRCAGDTPSGTLYESCSCVHAEQNAIALAARYGAGTQGAEIYLTAVEPCLSCLKSIVQAGIVRIHVGVDRDHDFFWNDHTYTEILTVSRTWLQIIRRDRLVFE